MQTPGVYISAVGHAGLIGWLILGWGFNAEPLPFEVTEVSVVSGEEFEQLIAAATPEPGDAAPTEPPVPQTEDTPPPPTVDETPTPAPQPDPVEPPVADTPPPEAPPPLVTDATVELPPLPETPTPPPSTPDVNVSDRPIPRRADVVASQPVAPPPLDTPVDDVVREEVVPDETADPDVKQDEQDPTAPTEITTEIVIVDETPSGALEASLRPRTRPSRPAPVADPTPEVVDDPQPASEPATSNDADVEAALAAALAGNDDAGTDAPAIAAGPPMTGSEKDAFRVAINRCWNIDPGSEAARVTVRVLFELDRGGRVVGSPRLISGSGGTDSSINIAFEAARRAILRCQGSSGYQLPEEKYDDWREVTANFNASGAQY